MRNKRIYLIFFLLGIAVALPFVFPALGFFSYVTLVPVILLVTRECPEMSKKGAYLVGLCFGMGYFGVMFHWFTEFYPMEFAGITKGTAFCLVAVCWIGLALVQALEFGAVTLAYRLIRVRSTRPVIGGMLFTALWVIFEWQQTFFWRGVPWARLAITQTNVLPALQSASVFGGLFVSGLIVSVNALLASAVGVAIDRLDSENGGEKAFSRIKGAIKNKKTVILALVALGIYLLNIGFGAVRMMTYNEEKGTPVKAAVIQGNISSLDKWGTSAIKSLNIYLDLTEKCVRETGAELVVWPETVIPSNISLYPNVMTRIAQKADELDITLFVGAFDKALKANEDGEREEYNAIYLFHPDGKISDQRYYKQRLVPFGEYTPMADIIFTVLPVLDTFNLFNDPLSPGKGTQLFDTAHGKVGSLICFDSIYDYLSSEAVADGAELITLSTNDSWFTDSPAVWQHNSHARLRAIESGRYIVRAASTGVSSILTPTGAIIAEIEPLTEGYAEATVYTKDSRTVYSYIGNIAVYICIGYTASVISFKVTRYLKNKKTVTED